MNDKPLRDLAARWMFYDAMKDTEGRSPDYAAGFNDAEVACAKQLIAALDTIDEDEHEADKEK